MKILLQRVGQASVSVENQVIGSIQRGYLLLIGIEKGDTEPEAAWLVQKVVNLRLWDGEDGKVNDRSLLDIGGEILAVSQFTLAGDVRKGNRPDYTAAASPADAEHLYERCVALLQEAGISKVETGKFGAHMQVELINDGPVTLLLERRSGAHTIAS